MKNEKFYIKKIGSRGNIKIWLVDGNKIRRDLNIEFTNFGHRFNFPFIPKYEFWLDKEAAPNERRFFIDHLLTEWQFMKMGYPPSLATKAADKKEALERWKVGISKKIIDKDGLPSLEKVQRRLLKRINNKISIWLVRGDLVRSVFNIQFTEGGHDLVFYFVPNNEIWLDDDVLTKERPYIILHELYERSLMAKGATYEKAHRKASKIEWQARQDKNKLQENLAPLGWKE